MGLATGYFAFQLAALVQHKVYHRCPGAVFHYTLLLVLFGSSAFKREHSGLLALTLPGCLAAVPDLVRLSTSVPAVHAVHTCNQPACDACIRTSRGELAAPTNDTSVKLNKSCIT